MIEKSWVVFSPQYHFIPRVRFFNLLFLWVKKKLLFMLTPCLYRKAVKATLVLLPLLGITYMLFFVNPGEDDISQIVFIYFNSFLQSFQVRMIFFFTVYVSGQRLKNPHVWITFHRRVASCIGAPFELSGGRIIWASILAVLTQSTSLPA